MALKRRNMHITSCLVVLAGSLVVAGEAGAQGVVASDCNLDFTNTYNKGDAVCVTGEFDYVPPQKIFAEAYVYVIPADAANPFADVTGAPNYIIGAGGAGSFFDEYVWLPPLKTGQYEFVIDNYPFFIDQKSAYDPGKDMRTGFAFSVTSAPTVWSVDPIKIKTEAVKGLQEALGIRVLTSALAAIDAISTVVDWSMGLGTGGGIAAGIIGIVCNAASWDCPTSYNSAVITIGNKILNGIADSLEKKYLAIIADPPDPNFAAPVPLDLDELVALGFPATPAAEHPFARGQTQIANLIALQSGAYLALVPSLEKVQGAQQAKNNLGMLIQAEKVKAYAELAIAAGDRLLVEADAFAAYLSGAGILEVGHAKDVFNAQLQALKDGGLGEDEKKVIYSYGISDAEMEAAVEVMKTWEPLAEDVDYGAVLKRVRGSYTSFKPALQDLVAQAEKVRAENEEGTLRPGPRLTIAAPAAGKVGVAQALGASATHFDPTAKLEYAWDLDLDGDFDDATGAQVMYAPPAPGAMLVSARVSDGKLIDYAYAFVDATISNSPPEVTVLTPIAAAPFADVGEQVDLHVEVVDADGDPTKIVWTVDGAPAGEGEDLAFVMPDEEAHRISVVISDDDPHSPDVTIGKVIRAKKWESMIPDPTGGETEGETTNGGTSDATGDATGDGVTTGSGGGDSVTGGDSDTPTGGGPDSPTSQGGGSDGGAGGGSTGDTAGSAGEGGGCGCRSQESGVGGSLLVLGLLGLRRRRR